MASRESVFHDGDDSSRGDEPCEIVDVTARVIARNAPSQPQNLADSKEIAEGLFVVFACHAGIALLLLAQQTLLRREHCAMAVDVNRASFENDPAEAVLWPPDLHTASTSDLLGYGIIFPPVRISGPCRETPACGSDFLFVHDKQRAAVTHPGAIGREPVELDL